MSFVARKFAAFNFSEATAKSSVVDLLREEFDGLPTRRFVCKSSDSIKFKKDGVLLSVRPMRSVF